LHITTAQGFDPRNGLVGIMRWILEVGQHAMAGIGTSDKKNVHRVRIERARGIMRAGTERPLALSDSLRFPL
jgi:hypothetical protein